MRAKETFSVPFWTFVLSYREPWSSIQQPDAPTPHHTYVPLKIVGHLEGELTAFRA